MSMLPIALGFGKLPAGNPYIGSLRHGESLTLTSSPKNGVIRSERNNPHVPYMRHAPPRTDSMTSLEEWEIVEPESAHASYVHVRE